MHIVTNTLQGLTVTNQTATSLCNVIPTQWAVYELACGGGDLMDKERVRESVCVTIGVF